MAENRNENLKKINELLTSGKLEELKKKISETEGLVKNFKSKLVSVAENISKVAEEQIKSEAERVSVETDTVDVVTEETEKAPKKAQSKKAKATDTTSEEVKSEVTEEVPTAEVKEEKPIKEEKVEETKKPNLSFIVRRAEFIPENKPTRKEFTPRDNKGGFKKDFNGANRGEFTPRDNKPFNKKPQPAFVAPDVVTPNNDKRSFGKKNKNQERSFEEKHTVSKRSLIREVDIDDFDENKTGYRKFRPVKKEKAVVENTIKIERAVITQEIIPLKVLSEKIGITATEITKRLFKEGIMKTINDSIDFDTAAYIADDLGVTLELKLEKSAEDVLSENFEGEADDTASLVKRPPVVTVMGHVDHGKTSLLDKIRKANVQAGEAGGITQHIGAYQTTLNGEVITFLDTPGHAAFTAMRARGAEATDIAVLVVAADDGIMPQTIEAINHAKAANVPIIVAVNKMDKPEANIEKVKTELTEHELLPEEWGGDTIVCPVSAKTGEGIDKLLENILLVAEVKELRANPNRKAKGVVIEAKLDNSKGPIATILIQNGTLKVGDSVVVGTVTGRIRAMSDDKGRRVNSALPSSAVSIMGLDEVPNAGDTLYAVEQDKLMKMVAEERKNKERENMIKAQQKVTLDDVFNKISEGEMKGLNIIVKADVQGSVEAVKSSLEKLSNEEVKVNVIHAGVGAIKESDIMLAESSKAVIIGFNVRPDTNAKQVAEHSGVDIKLYRVIYEAIEDVEKALKGMLAPKITETYMGKAEVREVFKISGVGQVAGCYVVDGKIIRSGKLRIYRDDIMICEGNVLQLKRFKDDVKEVASGYECGISIEKFNDIKVGDFIESYEVGEEKD